MKSDINRMLKEIEDEAELTATYTGKEHFSNRVMSALREVPREKFVSDFNQYAAYRNSPLPIGCGQTISQPYIVALMTELLDLTPDSIVLEVGTGSGYQAAVLSRLAKKVYSIERIPELYSSSSKRLDKLGYNNVETRCSNGYHGWIEKAPFDAIIVTAAALYIPDTLEDQLKPGGRMIIPVGPRYGHQQLMLVEKQMDGSTETKSLLAVSFVPMEPAEMDRPKETH